MEYHCRRVADLEHTASKQRRSLTSLHKSVRRFGRTLQQYETAGRPGWTLVESAAERHLASLCEERRTLNTELPTKDPRGADLRARIRQIDQAIIFHEQHSAGLLNQMVRGAGALDVWLSMVLRDTKDGELIASQRAEKGEAHVTAERWLIATAIPEIYETAFVGKAVARRAMIDPKTAKPSGAKLAFTRTTLREFGVTTTDGKNFSAHTIDEYWRGPRKRRGSKGVQSNK